MVLITYLIGDDLVLLSLKIMGISPELIGIISRPQVRGGLVNTKSFNNSFQVFIFLAYYNNCVTDIYWKSWLIKYVTGLLFFVHLFLLQGLANNVNIIIIPTRKMVYLLECSGPRICIQFLFPPCIVQHDSNLISFHFRTHAMSQHQFKLHML